MKTTLLVVTLNEIDGMKAVMPHVDRNWVDQIIVSDGGSTDGTIEWAKAQGYELVVCPERGLTNAYMAAWPLVHGEIVIIFLPDGNCLPQAIPVLIDKMKEGYDLVIASRYLPPAKSFDDDTITRFGNGFFRFLVNFLLGRGNAAKLTDPLGGFRAFRKGLPERLGVFRAEPMDKFFLTRSCFLPLISMRALSNKIRWTEIPSDEPARIGGKRKLQIFRYGALHVAQILREWLAPYKSTPPEVDGHHRSQALHEGGGQALEPVHKRNPL